MKKRRILRSFKSKIVVSILAVGILAVFLGLSVIFWIGRQQIQKTIGAQFKELAYETGRKLVFLLEQDIQEARLLAMASEVRATAERANESYDGRPPTEPEIRLRIENLLEQWKTIENNPASQYFRFFLADPTERAEYLSLLITDRQGFVIGADAQPRSVYYGDQEWWKAVIDQGRGKVYVSDVQRIPQAAPASERVYGLGLVVPVMNESRTQAIGVLRADVQIKPFFDAVINVKGGQTDHTMLASSDGTLIFCPVFPVGQHALRPEFMKAVFQDRPGWAVTTVDVHYGGRSSINGFSPVELGENVLPASLNGKRWFIFNSQNPDETYASIHVLQNWVAVSGIIGAIVLSLMGIYAAGFIVKPLQDLRKGVRLIGYGNLDHRLRIETGDEIEELAEEFNEMSIKLKASYSGLEKKISERTRELAAVNKITRTISSNLNLRMIFETFTEEIRKLIDYDLISLALLDESRENIQIHYIKLKNEPLVLRDPPLKPKDGTAIGFAVDEGRPFIREDTHEARQFTEDGPADSNDLRSYLVIPIVSKCASIGAIRLASRQPCAYSPRNCETLLPIAEQMGIAIETIRLFEETQKLDQLKSEFVSKVSHELRTPLTSIKGFTEILLAYDDIDPATQKEFLGIINEESERLVRLINDILDLSKIEAGKVQLKIQPVAVAEFVQAAERLMRSAVMKKNLRMEVRVPENLPAVRGDRDQLLQVMENLLSNAVKFTPNGKITAGAVEEGGFVRISVGDTGIGIPRQEQTRIFEKFYQPGGAPAGNVRGTGLGLAICKEIVTRLGGRIWSESEPGKGSTFHFAIPIWTKDLRYAEPTVKAQTPQTNP